MFVPPRLVDHSLVMFSDPNFIQFFSDLHLITTTYDQNGTSARRFLLGTNRVRIGLMGSV